MDKPAKKAIMGPNPSELISALQSEVAGLDLPLPIIVEKWLNTENGRIRLAVCRSRYGWHWEIGSSRNKMSPPLQIVHGNHSELACATLRQFLQSNATAQTNSDFAPL